MRNKRILQCAGANAVSLQEAAGLQGDTLADIFLSNDVSQLVQLLLGPERAEAFLQTLADNPTPVNIIDQGAAVAAQIPTNTEVEIAEIIPNTGGVVRRRMHELALGEKLLGRTASKVVAGVALVKGVFDVYAFGYSAVKCQQATAPSGQH